MRETFKSALTFGTETLRELGEAEDTIGDVMGEVRRRDAERMAMQLTGDITSGRDLLLSNLTPEQRRLAQAAPIPASLMAPSQTRSR